MSYRASIFDFLPFTTIYSSSVSSISSADSAISFSPEEEDCDTGNPVESNTMLYASLLRPGPPGPVTASRPITGTILTQLDTQPRPTIISHRHNPPSASSRASLSLTKFLYNNRMGAGQSSISSSGCTTPRHGRSTSVAGDIDDRSRDSSRVRERILREQQYREQIQATARKLRQELENAGFQAPEEGFEDNIVVREIAKPGGVAKDGEAHRIKLGGGEGVLLHLEEPAAEGQRESDVAPVKDGSSHSHHELVIPDLEVPLTHPQVVAEPGGKPLSVPPPIPAPISISRSRTPQLEGDQVVSILPHNPVEDQVVSILPHDPTPPEHNSPVLETETLLAAPAEVFQGLGPVIPTMPIPVAVELPAEEAKSPLLSPVDKGKHKDFEVEGELVLLPEPEVKNELEVEMANDGKKDNAEEPKREDALMAHNEEEVALKVVADSPAEFALNGEIGERAPKAVESDEEVAPIEKIAETISEVVEAHKELQQAEEAVEEQKSDSNKGNQEPEETREEVSPAEIPLPLTPPAVEEFKRVPSDSPHLPASAQEGPFDWDSIVDAVLKPHENDGEAEGAKTPNFAVPAANKELEDASAPQEAEKPTAQPINILIPAVDTTENDATSLSPQTAIQPPFPPATEPSPSTSPVEQKPELELELDITKEQPPRTRPRSPSIATRPSLGNIKEEANENDEYYAPTAARMEAPAVEIVTEHVEAANKLTPSAGDITPSIVSVAPSVKEGETGNDKESESGLPFEKHTETVRDEEPKVKEEDGERWVAAYKEPGPIIEAEGEPVIEEVEDRPSTPAGVNVAIPRPMQAHFGITHEEPTSPISPISTDAPVSPTDNPSDAESVQEKPESVKEKSKMARRMSMVTKPFSFGKKKEQDSENRPQTADSSAVSVTSGENKSISSESKPKLSRSNTAKDFMNRVTFKKGKDKNEKDTESILSGKAMSVKSTEDGEMPKLERRNTRDIMKMAIGKMKREKDNDAVSVKSGKAPSMKSIDPAAAEPESPKIERRNTRDLMRMAITKMKKEKEKDTDAVSIKSGKAPSIKSVDPAAAEPESPKIERRNTRDLMRMAITKMKKDKERDTDAVSVKSGKAPSIKSFDPTAAEPETPKIERRNTKDLMRMAIGKMKKDKERDTDAVSVKSGKAPSLKSIDPAAVDAETSRIEKRSPKDLMRMAIGKAKDKEKTIEMEAVGESAAEADAAELPVKPKLTRSNTVMSMMKLGGRRDSLPSPEKTPAKQRRMSMAGVTGMLKKKPEKAAATASGTPPESPTEVIQKSSASIAPSIHNTEGISSRPLTSAEDKASIFAKNEGPEAALSAPAPAPAAAAGLPPSPPPTSHSETPNPASNHSTSAEPESPTDEKKKNRWPAALNLGKNKSKLAQAETTDASSIATKSAATSMADLLNQVREDAGSVTSAPVANEAEASEQGVGGNGGQGGLSKPKLKLAMRARTFMALTSKKK